MDRMGYKKKKKSSHPIRLLLILIIIILLIICYYQYTNFDNLDISVITQILSSIKYTENTFSSEHIIAGQTKIENRDGYTTIFTTLNNKNEKTYIEYKQNLESSSWSENSYWGGTMAQNGCGITSISIIASGYGVNVTPEDLRNKYYPHLDSEKIPEALESLGIKCSDFYYYKTYLSKEYITKWLSSNRPVLVCVDNSKEDNIWTTLSHYMVLLEVDSDGLIYVSNPNGEDGAENASGWYNAEEILPYVVKALFIESY
jgi:hypothetical protein